MPPAQETAVFALTQGEDAQRAELEGLVTTHQTLRTQPAYRLVQVLEGLALERHRPPCPCRG